MTVTGEDTMTVNSHANIAACLLGAVALALSGALAAEELTQEEAGPESFVSLRFDGTCDERNNRLWLSNTHTYKTIVARGRWRAAGGKALTEQFFPPPDSIREIGCAAEAEILEARFAEF